MRYENIIEGKFISRPNRFIADVLVDNKEEKAHVKNTGRCRELLIPGAHVYVEDHYGRMGKRKMRYSLISVRKGNILINMDSQAPNHVVREALITGKIRLPGMSVLTKVRGEYQYGESRLDFYVEDTCDNRGLVEVKGVTLETGGVARFPDAPTERGIKHINELAGAMDKGYKVYIIFVIQMKGVHLFEPNDETHEAFGTALRHAVERGVNVLAYDCKVEPNLLEVDSEIPVRL